MDENAVAKEVVDAAYQIHVKLGPGLLESVYEILLEHDLRNRGLTTRRQVTLPVKYKGIVIESGYRLDLLIEDKLIVEIKSVERTEPVHRKQLLTYLRLADKRLGLLLNFGLERIKDGTERVVNGLDE